jgi:hypothetical protein
MLDALLSYLFGCPHATTTFPLTRNANHSAGSGARNTYVACLKCGAEFVYDWERMRVGMPLPTCRSLRQPLNWGVLEARRDSTRVTINGA